MRKVLFLSKKSMSACFRDYTKLPIGFSQNLDCRCIWDAIRLSSNVGPIQKAGLSEIFKNLRFSSPLLFLIIVKSTVRSHNLKYIIVYTVTPGYGTLTIIKQLHFYGLSKYFFPIFQCFAIN